MFLYCIFCKLGCWLCFPTSNLSKEGFLSSCPKKAGPATHRKKKYLYICHMCCVHVLCVACVCYALCACVMRCLRVLCVGCVCDLHKHPTHQLQPRINWTTHQFKPRINWTTQNGWEVGKTTRHTRILHELNIYSFEVVSSTRFSQARKRHSLK